MSLKHRSPIFLFVLFALVLILLVSVMTGCKSEGGKDTLTSSGETNGVGFGTDSGETEQPLEESPASDFIYKENEDGTMTIIGYKGTDTNIVVPAQIDGKTVTVFGDLIVVYPNDYIRTVIFPDTVTRIGRYAFKECANLSEVILPNSLVEIGQQAFADCPL